MQYKLLVAILGLAMIAGTVGVVSAQAQTNDPGGSLVTRIADRFHLQEADVQAVFDEERAAHQQEMEVRFDDKLAKAVSSGKITEAQKQLIIEKRTELEQEMQTKRDEFKNMTPAQRQEVLSQHHQELKDWAEANGIDLKYLMPGPKDGPHHGHGPDGVGRRMMAN